MWNIEEGGGNNGKYFNLVKVNYLLRENGFTRIIYLERGVFATNPGLNPIINALYIINRKYRKF